MSSMDGEFLRIRKPLRELRGVSWPAKALAEHIRFRQRDREQVGIGIRRLAKDLGMAQNTVLRAGREAAKKGLLRIVNPDAPRGQRRLFDARSMDTWQSASTSDALSSASECISPCGKSASAPVAGECISPCDRSASTPAARQEVVKKNSAKKGEERPPAPTAHATRNGNDNSEHRGDPDAAILGVAEEVRGRSLTGREAAAFSQAVDEARAAGATDAGIGDGIRKAGSAAPVWIGPNIARDAAGGRLAELLVSYQRAARLPNPRKTLAEIAVDVQYAREQLARTPQPAPGDEGVALWRDQLAWADRNAADLAAVSTCDPNPRLAHQAGPGAARASG
jgi:hypothetical protein